MSGGKVRAAVQPLIRALRHDDPRTVNAACAALSAIDPGQRTPVIDALCRNTAAHDQAVARLAVEKLIELTAEGSEPEQRRAVAALAAALRSAEGDMIRTIIVALGAFGKQSEPAAGLIEEAIWAGRFRDEAAAAMKRIRPGRPVRLQPDASARIEDDLGLDL